MSQDVSIPDTPMLSNDERYLYSRQLNLPSWGEGAQIKLKRSRVFVAGCGGLGSPVCYYLGAAGVGTLILCDSDTVEPSNLNRQIIHRYDRVGTAKTESAQLTLANLNPFIHTEVIRERIEGHNAIDLVGDSDIIIDCLDNFASRHVINRVSVERGIPMVHAGVSGFIGQVTFLHPPETPCLACLIPGDRDDSPRDIIGATPGIVGSIQALEALKYLAGTGETLKNRLLFIDGFAMRFETVTVAKTTRCNVCGPP